MQHLVKSLLFRSAGIKLLFHTTRYEMYMTGFFSGPKRQCLNSIISEFENGHYAANTLAFLFCMYYIKNIKTFCPENMKKPPSKALNYFSCSGFNFNFKTILILVQSTFLFLFIITFWPKNTLETLLWACARPICKCNSSKAPFLAFAF